MCLVCAVAQWLIEVDRTPPITHNPSLTSNYVHADISVDVIISLLSGSTVVHTIGTDVYSKQIHVRQKGKKK